MFRHRALTVTGMFPGSGRENAAIHPLPIGKRENVCKLYFMPTLSPAKIKTELRSVPDWKKKGSTITRTYDFKDFPGSVKFVNAVARIAEKAWHHPDIDIRWNKVTLALTTHDAGGLTEKDFKLAKQFDRI
jgi:4a-hydroxytetrahydrobiopterin dehydratase